MDAPMKRVVIVGGGYAGTAFAVHLSRATPRPLDVVLVEPRNQVGGGLAHSDPDPDHRLNAPDVVHPLYPDDELHFRHWLEHSGRLAADPASWANGRLYPRRGDFGAYLAGQFAAHTAGNPSSSSLAHCRERAIGLERHSGGFRVALAGGACIDTDRCVIALGNEPAPPRLPGTISGLGTAMIANPFAPGALAAIDHDADVLILGTGLTAADVVASLRRQRHRATITCLSRRGQRPHEQNPEPSPRPLWEQIAVRPPAFVERHGLPTSVLALTRIVRQEIRDRVDRGKPWHPVIDDIRDAASDIWRSLSNRERLRFLRHLKPYYDSHRFRIPPPTRDILQAALDDEQLSYWTGRVIATERDRTGLKVAVRPRGDETVCSRTYGAIINCAGLSSRVDLSRNPFVQSCLRQGLTRPSATNRGFDADEWCQVVSAKGLPNCNLHVVGSMNLDGFGEQPAAIFILRQILEMLPAYVASA
jgi:uncharacterized NAD(P)/FAD-binding protein YdhS